MEERLKNIESLLLKLVNQNDTIIEIMSKSIDIAINGDDVLNEDYLDGKTFGNINTG